MTGCPCGGDSLQTCCGPYVHGTLPAPTAEALMRSRYTAYVLGLIPYLSATHLPQMSEHFDPVQAAHWSQASQWQRLDVLDVVGGGTSDAEGYVEFMATFRQDGQVKTHHERSHFVRQGPRWYYASGSSAKQDSAPQPKVGRNAPCPCGSGKKYKRCCA